MSSTPFNYALGTAQARVVQPSGWSPPAEGTAAYVLGHDKPGQRWKLRQGDYVEVSQSADWAADLLRFSAKIRPPSLDGNSFLWNLELRVDGVVFASLGFSAGDRTRVHT